MPDLQAMGRKRVVYELPHMDQARVRRDIEFKRAGDLALRADIYTPPAHSDDTPLPTVIFISGDAPPDVVQAVGGKTAGQYVSWGELAAASGLAAVVGEHRWTEGYTRVQEVAEDVADLLGYVRTHGPALGLDTTRLAIWTASGGPPYALSAVMRETPPDIRCLVSYYGVLDLQPMLKDTDASERVATVRAFSPVFHLPACAARMPPLLIARAGQDNPAINASVDRFMAEALRTNAPIELINHPHGQHAFDVLDDDDRSREIIRRTLDFLAAHLTGDAPAR